MNNLPVNWFELFLINQLGNSNINIPDIISSQKILVTDTINENTIKSIQIQGKTLSEEFNGLDKRIENLQNSKDLREIKEILIEILNKNSLISRLENIEKAIRKIDKDIEAIKEIFSVK